MNVLISVECQLIKWGEIVIGERKEVKSGGI